SSIITTGSWYSRRTMSGLKMTAAVLVALMAPPLSRSQSSSSPGSVLSKYCLTCHNEKLKTAGFVIDPPGVAHAGAHPDAWEKVVRKLRTKAMPPAGVPRPDDATVDSTVSFIEADLDRVAGAKPTPGKLPLLRRLTRTEYQNAIRDLLALDALPK